MKFGKNDPCYCGSSKLSKQCCGHLSLRLQTVAKELYKRNGSDIETFRIMVRNEHNKERNKPERTCYICGKDYILMQTQISDNEVTNEQILSGICSKQCFQEACWDPKEETDS